MKNKYLGAENHFKKYSLVSITNDYCVASVAKQRKMGKIQKHYNDLLLSNVECSYRKLTTLTAGCTDKNDDIEDATE